MDIFCKFSIGQIIHHLRFGYRGVIIDVDSNFQGSEEWYLEMAKSNPPRDKPWYHVLVDQTSSVTYVAERHLANGKSFRPILHPLIEQYFRSLDNGYYQINLC